MDNEIGSFLASYVFVIDFCFRFAYFVNLFFAAYMCMYTSVSCFAELFLFFVGADQSQHEAKEA